MSIFPCCKLEHIKKSSILKDFYIKREGVGSAHKTSHWEINLQNVSNYHAMQWIIILHSSRAHGPLVEKDPLPWQPNQHLQTSGTHIKCKIKPPLEWSNLTLKWAHLQMVYR